MRWFAISAGSLGMACLTGFRSSPGA